MNTINIKGTDYKVKYTIRAMFLFELITGKSFELKTLLDNYLFFYCLILANNPDTVLEWDDYIDALDTDPTIYKQLNQIVENEQKKSKLLGEESDKVDSKKN